MTHDLILYGATGYTGRLVAEHLLARYPDLDWAMAGRSLGKLAEVRDLIGAPGDLPLVVADAADPASMTALAESAKVIVTTVGPYQLYGSALVAACAAAGTDYVDLCGEPAWMAEMIEAHDATAEASGARILFSCGFDSIPFDLGVLVLEDEAIRRFGAPATRVRGRVRAMKGGFSGGTAASLGATLQAAARDPEVRRRLTDPFALAPGFDGPAQPADDQPYRDEVAGSWVAPFVMATINTKNVHRTNFLLGHRYGADFRYDEMMMTGDGEAGEARARAVAAQKGLGGGRMPQPGEGPTPEEREAGFYDLLFVGDTGDGGTMRASVKGDRDPGYGSTSRMIAEAALCLLHDVPEGGAGVGTPGAVLGRALVDRLQANAGIRFAVGDDA